MKRLISIGAMILALGLATSAMADALNTRPVTIGGTSDPMTLQQVLDSYIAPGALDAQLDQNPAALWQTSDVNVNAWKIVRLAGDAGNLGIYSASTGAQYSFGDMDQVDFLINNAGQLFINGVSTDNAFGQGFGFYWQNTAQDPDIFSYTEDSKNGDDARALSYLLASGSTVSLPVYGDITVSGNDDWILAFEDLICSDYDYQDAVFLIEDMTPVPEPATLLLLGSGFALFGRRLLRKNEA